MNIEIEVRAIHVKTAENFVHQRHYAKTMPAQTRYCLGGFVGESLIAVATWGYGVRPLHTIRKLFPSLIAKDYLELGRLCVSDEMPRNTESRFISLCVKHLKQTFPQIVLLFTWADGLLGKPGYVYQGSGWLYGGFIWTDAYFTPDGEKVHPRLYQTKTHEGQMDGLKYGRRPSRERLESLNWKHYFGKQFRYVLFLCGHKRRKQLLRESTVKWSQKYPKRADLEWKISAGQGSRVSCEAPNFTGAVQFRSPAPLFDVVCESQNPHTKGG